MRVLLLSIAIVFLFCGVSVPDLNAAVIRVASGDPITAALSSVAPHDTIMLEAGTYYENVHIEIPILLQGNGEAHIQGDRSGHTILITAAGTVLSGLRVSDSGTRLIEDMACIRIEADSVEVRNCHVTKPLHGIYVKGGSYTYLHDNVISGRLDLQEADRGNGIHLWNSKHNRLSGNEIFNVRDGIYFSFADSTEVYDNHIHHVRYGLHYMYSNVNRFADNLFENNVAGAALMYSQEIEFYRNVFARCRSFRAYGILFQSVDRSTAIHNLVIDNSRGLYLSNSDQNQFYNNDVIDNDLAMQINGSCDDNIVVGNNFIGNLHNVLVDHERSSTVWSKENAGNYWDDYRGYDLDGDGIGDVPHQVQNVFQIVEMEIPEVRLYLLSPAAEILAAAERALPILSLGSEKDPSPLFRATINQDVPWHRVGSSAREPDLLLAGMFLVGSVIPTLLLIGIGRKKK